MMKLPSNVLIPLLVTVLLNACHAPNPSCAPLPGGQYCLQPSTAETALSVQQKVVAQFGHQRETMIADIEADAQGMQFIALTPFGQKVLHVAYDNLAVSAPLLAHPRLDAAQLLALLQIALWPADAVERGLQGLKLQQTPTGRRILDGDRIVIDVSHDATSRSHRRLTLAMPTLGAVLDMETLPNAAEDAP